MGTQQSVTTEQMELLTLLADIEDLIKELQKDDPEYEFEGNPFEIAVTGDILDEDAYQKAEFALLDCGYIELDERQNAKLTITGRKYVDLFRDYIEASEKDPNVEKAKFSLIDTTKFQINLLSVNLLSVTGVTAMNILKKLLRSK